MTVDLRITRSRFYESTIHDGDVTYHRHIVEDYADLELGEAIETIRRSGAEFRAHGGGDAVDPDGSRIIDFAEGEREEIHVRVYNTYAWERDAIVAGVDCREYGRVGDDLPDDFDA